MLEFVEEPLAMLGIHSLSRGQTMQIVLHCMPTFLNLFEEKKTT